MLAEALVETTDMRRGRGWKRRRHVAFARAAEAVAEEELLVFAIDVEDLEEFGAGFFDDVFALRIGAHGGRGGLFIFLFERGETAVELGEEFSFALEKGGVGDAFLGFQKLVFLERELMELLAEDEVMMQVGSGGH